MNTYHLKESLDKLVLDLEKIKETNKLLKYANKRLRAENNNLHDIIEASPFMSYDKPKDENVFN